MTLEFDGLVAEGTDYHGCAIGIWHRILRLYQRTRRLPKLVYFEITEPFLLNINKHGVPFVFGTY